MMKRTKTFVLLCVFVLALCAGAWADVDVVKAPLNDHSENADNDQNTPVNVSDYGISVEEANENTQDKPHKVYLTATDLPLHYNGGHLQAYWIGIGILHQEGATYEWGLKGSDSKQTDKTAEFTEGEKKYDTFYWGTYTSFSDKTGYLNVKVGETTTYYEIDFSNVTTQGNDFVNLKSDASGITATPTPEFDTFSAHKAAIKFSGKLAPDSNNKYIVNIANIPAPSVGGVTITAATGTGEPTLGNGVALKEDSSYKAVASESTITEDGTTAGIEFDDTTKKGYIAFKYSGPKNVTLTDKDRLQYVLYTLDFSGITKATASSATAPAKVENLTYTGKAQELVTAGTATGGTLQYATGENATTAPTSGWADTIPTGTDVKTYYVWYKVVGDETHTDTEPASLDVSISKGTASVTAPKAKTLSHNGSAQALVEAGTATLGTLQYAIGENATTAPTSGWADTIPTGTNAGTYYVWYKVDSTDNYNGADAACVTVTISGSAPAAKPALTLSLTVASSDLKAGTVGETYTEDLTKHITVTTNGSYTWSATGLPAGLSASTAGAITGTPTASADKKAVTVTVKATSTDLEAKTETGILYITINAKTVDIDVPGTESEEPKPVESDEVKPDEPVTPVTSDDEAVKEIENLLSGDETLTKEQVETVISNLESLSNDVTLSSTEAEKLLSSIITNDSELNIAHNETAVKAVAKALVSDDGTITAEAMTTLTNSLTTKDSAGATTLTAEALTSADSTAAKIAVAALASSVENSGTKKELNLETVPLTSLSGIDKLLEQVVAGSSTTASTSELTLDLGKVETLKTVDNLENVSLKAITLENNATVKEVKLDGATIGSVDMKGSKVTEVSLNASSNVKEIDASGSDLTSIDLASNDNIVTLNISETNVSELNAAGCAGLENLTADGGSEGAGELKEVNLEGCVKLKKLALSNNKLLGVKKPSGFTKPNGFTFKARGQRRTSDTNFSAGMNLFKFIVSLSKSVLSTADADTTSNDLPFDIGDIISVKVDGNEASIDNEGNLSAIPTKSFSYELDPFGLVKNKNVEDGSVSAAAEDDGMEVTISGEGEESNGISGSGGGCDLVRSEELGVRSVLVLALFLLGLMELAPIKFRRS